ncbi:nucleotide-binding universal stress UspA family protein [Variovorax paradoxus]
MKTKEEAAESEAAKTGRMLRASLRLHQIAPMLHRAASGVDSAQGSHRLGGLRSADMPIFFEGASMQTPKSILLHLDGSARTAQRLQLARSLAEAFGARVTAMPCTMSAIMRYPFALEGAAEAIAIMRASDKAARAPLLRFTRRARLACGGPSRRATRHGALPAMRRNKLLSMAAVLGADLLVMGCYGHSRAREWILGGATRTILETMTLPVLLSH